MTCYSVYLELGLDGTCMVHVPALPGCAVRAQEKGLALEQLPEAIRDYWRWLRQHGEAAPSADEPIELVIAGESKGFGPFAPGDAAALFAADLAPVTPEEEDGQLRLMAYSRADLLRLVERLSDEQLDWQPAPEEFSLRRVLRHIGNAEEWYVSRLVSPESLPLEWQDDEKLPVLAFLDMERRTVVEQLRSLSRDQRSLVFHPSHWTAHPDEAWTLRKVLRRFLEHEREHTSQVREILAAFGSPDPNS